MKRPIKRRTSTAPEWSDFHVLFAIFVVCFSMQSERGEHIPVGIDILRFWALQNTSKNQFKRTDECHAASCIHFSYFIDIFGIKAERIETINWCVFIMQLMSELTRWPPLWYFLFVVFKTNKKWDAMPQRWWHLVNQTNTDYTKAVSKFHI